MEIKKGRIKKKRIIIIVLCTFLCMALVGIFGKKWAKQQNDEKIPQASRDIFAMDTLISITTYGEKAEEAASAAVDEINRLDDIFSVGNSDSDIVKLNKQKKAIVSEETFFLIERSIEMYKSTGGALDITIYPLMEAWGFTSENYRVPNQSEIAILLQRMQIEKIQCDRKTKTVTLPQDVEIDLGAIAKGYTSSRLMDIFSGYDLTSALVSLGGNVQVYRGKTDGSKWRVAVESPFHDDKEKYFGILELKDRAAITSGAYERYFEKDGVRYHHILDPSNGYPVENGISSVTIVSTDGTMADALSTALFVMGKEKIINYWRVYSDEFDFVLIEEDGSVTISEGLKESFSYDKKYSIIEREEKR